MQKLSLYSQNFIEWTLAEKIPCSDVEWAKKISYAVFGVSLDTLIRQKDTSKQASEKLHYIIRQVVRKNMSGWFNEYVSEKVIISMAG